MMLRRRIALAALCVMVLVGSAGALGFALRPAASPELLRPGTAETVAPVVPKDFDDGRKVQVRLVAADATTLLAQASGTLTASSCEVGGTIISGSITWRADGLPVIALHTTVPLYRDLAHGDQGEDVKALQQELARLGHLSPDLVDGYYGWDTSTAVQNLRETAGRERGEHVTQRAEFVWLPVPEITATRCDLAIGQQVSPGATLATAEGAIQRLEVTAIPQDLAAGDRALRLGEISGPVSKSGVVDDPTFLAEVAANAQLVAAMRKDPEATVTATLLLTKPRAAHTVPAGALIGTGQDQCVQTGKDETIPVDLLGSSLGTAVVAFPQDVPVPESVRIGTGVTETNCD